ncbi:OmpA family protein [Sorangium sp. So ce693]|uniref:OmpA family protein n=1 Tax=Sorangium sp. So ce693 TaxID=3133318 RepID=UPI003F5E2188
MRLWALRSLAAALAALVVALLLLPAPARAQDAPVNPGGMALSRFVPAPAGDRMFSVPSPFAAGHLTPHVMLLADYASNPLVLRRERDGAEIGAVVSDQLTFRLGASLPLWNKVSFDLDAPLTAVQSGESPSGGGQQFPSPSGAALGDVRLGARVQLHGTYHDPFQLAVGAYLWLPTGADDSFVSDGSVRAMPYVAVGGRMERLVWSTALGTEVRRSQSFGGVAQGTMLTLGGGVGFLAADGRLQVGPELSAAMVLEDLSSRSTNAELLLDARYRFLPFMEAGIGVGPGITSGIGTPDVRAVAMAAFTPEQPTDQDRDGIGDPEDACPSVPGVRSGDPKKNGCPPPPDRDADGIVDAEDACPAVAGVRSDDPKKNGCPPPPDRDADGIVDAEDACPAVAGVRSDDPKKNGCPPDQDDDGVADAEDACPDIKGFRSKNPEKNGCPRDTDGDTFRDDKDACPREKGFADPDPEKNGCPKAVRVTEKHVVILQQVQFDTNKATIKPVSDPLLDEVAEVLKEHPEIELIEIQGHTDNRGTVEHNRVLSQNRANSVMAALVRRGIDSTRLTAQGYGRDQPIDDNATEAGRQRNRRVQFNIIKQAAYKPQAETGEDR